MLTGNFSILNEIAQFLDRIKLFCSLLTISCIKVTGESQDSFAYCGYLTMAIKETTFLQNAEKLDDSEFSCKKNAIGLYKKIFFGSCNHID